MLPQVLSRCQITKIIHYLGQLKERSPICLMAALSTLFAGWLDLQSKDDIPGLVSNPLSHGKFPVVEGGRVRGGKQHSWELGVQAALVEDKNESFCGC